MGPTLEECLSYFRQTVVAPEDAIPWEAWWATHESLVERVFPLVDYVRLKHRGWLGARQILEKRGELPTAPASSHAEDQAN
jgi:hypothetical protein